MDMKFLSAVTGRSRDAINVIIKKAALKDELPVPKPGEPRKFTRDNVVKIFFISAALNAKGTIEGALVLAMRWVELERRGKLPKYYVRNPASGFDNEYDQIFPVNQMLVDLENQGGGGWVAEKNSRPFIPASELQIVGLQTMVDFIDDYYSQDGGPN